MLVNGRFPMMKYRQRNCSKIRGATHSSSPFGIYLVVGTKSTIDSCSSMSSNLSLIFFFIFFGQKEKAWSPIFCCKWGKKMCTSSRKKWSLHQVIFLRGRAENARTSWGKNFFSIKLQMCGWWVRDLGGQGLAFLTSRMICLKVS